MRHFLLAGVSIVLLGTQALAATAMTEKELQALLSNGKELTLGGPKEGYSGQLSVMKDWYRARPSEHG